MNVLDAVPDLATITTDRRALDVATVVAVLTMALDVWLTWALAINGPATEVGLGASHTAIVAGLLVATMYHMATEGRTAR